MLPFGTPGSGSFSHVYNVGLTVVDDFVLRRNKDTLFLKMLCIQHRTYCLQLPLSVLLSPCKACFSSGPGTGNLGSLSVAQSSELMA